MRTSAVNQSQLKTVGVEQTNSVVINGSIDDIARVETVLSSLDVEDIDQTVTAIIKLNFTDANSIADILDNMTSVQSNTRKVDVAEENTEKPLALKKKDAPTSLLPKNTSVASNRAKFDRTQVKVSIDEKANSVIITGSPRAVDNLQKIVKRLDAKRLQVMVEVLIVEMSADKSKQLGIQWGGVTNDLTAPNLTSNLGTIIGTIKTGGVINFSVLAEALATDADANLISAPSLLTLENEEAEITVGREVPFITGSFTSTGDGANPTNPFTTIERNNVGLTLRITPNINKGDVIKLKIDQEFSNILPNAKSTIGTADVVTSKRTIKTNVLVKNNQMLVLGGLIDDSVQERQNRTLGISKVPLLGHLFKNRSTTREKRNLMIFIQPHIVRDDGMVDQLTAERYNDMRSLQIQRGKGGVALLPKETPPILDDIYGQSEVYKNTSSKQYTNVLTRHDLSEDIFDE